MIVMLVADETKKERQYIVAYARELAAKWTDEHWKMLQCATEQELRKLVMERVSADIICVDLTIGEALSMTKELRKRLPHAYIILIANTKISPLTYMKPSIGAESLMLKPLDQKQIREVVSEAVEAYLRRFYKPDEKKLFLVENHGERNLIAYENIYFFESREKRVYLNTNSETYGFYDTLDQLEEKLAEGFIRCHRSFLVNKEKIKRIYLSQNRIVLEEDFEIPLSRTYKPALKEYMRKGEKANEGTFGKGISADV